jgi:threonine aldolase
MKYSFKNDYSEIAHHNIMEALAKLQMEQLDGYGLDTYSEKARMLLKKLLHNEKVDIHFVVGGTQANLTVISSMLRPYEAVIAVTSGHIFVHEAGAIEAN